MNLERFEDLRLVRQARDVEELLTGLRSRENLIRFPDDTVLFIDEIQEDSQVIQWLRFLYEDHPELAVIVAGSLMDVRLRGEGFSFPVGRVTFRELGPLTFLEFLGARGKDVLAESVRASFAGLEPLSPALHSQTMELLHDYLLVGGMPEAVSEHLLHGGHGASSRVHKDLLQAFAEDIQKYPTGTSCTEEAFANLRQHYGLRFKYSRFVPGRSTVNIQKALRALDAARIIHLALPAASLKLPVVEKGRVAPKLLPLDIGVALSDFGLPANGLAGVPIEDLMDGRFAECFVGQQLLSTTRPLHFWVRDDPRRQAELDFLLPASTGLLPIEVKSGKSGTLRSLHQFLLRSKTNLGVRLYSGPLKNETHPLTTNGNQHTCHLLSLPIYMAELLPDLETH